MSGRLDEAAALSERAGIRRGKQSLVRLQPASVPHHCWDCGSRAAATGARRRTSPDRDRSGGFGSLPDSTARCGYWYAEMLLARCAVGDRERALGTCSETLSGVPSVGCPGTLRGPNDACLRLARPWPGDLQPDELSVIYR